MSGGRAHGHVIVLTCCLCKWSCMGVLTCFHSPVPNGHGLGLGTPALWQRDRQTDMGSSHHPQPSFESSLLDFLPTFLFGANMCRATDFTSVKKNPGGLAHCPVQSLSNYIVLTPETPHVFIWILYHVNYRWIHPPLLPWLPLHPTVFPMRKHPAGPPETKDLFKTVEDFPAFAFSLIIVA